MISVMVASLAAIAFAVVFVLLKIIPVTFAVVEHAAAGAAAMFDPYMSDDEKEKSVRAAGLSTLGSCAGIALRLLACLAAACLPVFAAGWLALATVGDVLHIAESWPFLLGSTLVLSLAAWLFLRWQTDERKRCSAPTFRGLR